MNRDGEDGVPAGGQSDSLFRQQRMAAVQPIVTPTWVLGTFMTIGVLFVPLGAWLKLKYGEVVVYKERYDGVDKTLDCSITGPDEERECQVTFVLDADMAAPVYVLYELENFYQNHRNYVKSRSYSQLAGEGPSADSCSPVTTTGGESPADLSPCGLVANTFFNDVFVVDDAPHPFDAMSPYQYMDESGISWSPDRDGQFVQPEGFVSAHCADGASCEDCLGSALYSDCKTYMDKRTGTSYMYWYPDEDTTQYLYETYPEVISPVTGVSDEHFVVWMRNAALPTFRNVYGRINHDLDASANITFNITANFHVAGFGGSKSLILTTLSPIGSRNGVLGGAYMALGGACLAAGLLVLSKFQREPREFGDITHMGVHDED